ncbi:MAG TPA: bifunctional 2-C-methyl-D-erythritol 4-phosphate cytidylyltransferase/2-C-methyl-D-erythritol 2,4-cyclodiphosphate synthase [Brevundimonas sp.]|jgi:2-C-methyl-D-erythritol 4-phosphate cytidylyltransferase/2-C-methyl-D-erythritol 2,4-cyclodiphosphate synthase|uniref:bifunctional 2-C-methyl-D-erythritol 4-phosphate cytidylyltransferase/2-C-methyl-D-erythritol 2,4-cyclodiphosphate synthase n=1 Tax=Brevundimonas sp. TaxID=1871086 RepID=UPI002DE88F6E|nr:bifunctional 2-C-methyl-D-erythritol 4-phosphate cytidylyltransferase/2-C-methyl-D-erythritol 2,4-cyclodiphosphate synthase [Brevundimonas sp.]
MTFSAVVVAAGSGSRAGGAKQWRLLGGVPVVRRSVKALLDAGAHPVVVCIPQGADAEAERALAGLEGWIAVTGGADRAASVRAGLAALPAAPEDRPILVHDAARPLLGATVIDALLAALEAADAAAPVLPVPDSLGRDDAGRVGETVVRDGLLRIQTPQAARLGPLVAALDAWTGPVAPTDETEALRSAGLTVIHVPGDARLMKLTHPEDFAMAEALLASTERRVTRVGHGYDVHRWGPGGAVWLCGVEIPHDRSLVGHSDADAGLHALTDAILGALADGDIGDHFPPSDPRWKGAASDAFLAHARDLARARGGRIVHADVTLICERPKVKPHRQAMRERIAAVLDLPLHAVSVKATTTEGLGFTGRDEGLAAMATATLDLPE